MIKKTFLGLLLLALLSIYGCQIIPANHKPLLLDMNNDKSSNSLTLSFNISENGNAITLFRGYAFVAKIPNGVTAVGTSSCSVSNTTGSIGTFVQTIISADNEIRCVFSEAAVSGLALSGKITLTFTGLKITVKSNNSISLGLFTDVENGILLVKNASFKNFSMYNDYVTMTSPLISLSKANVITTTQSLDCPSITSTTPCNNLYPYNNFDLSFEVDVTKYISTKDANIGFEIIGNFDASSISISSVAIAESNSGETGFVADPLLSKLKSSDSNGLLTLTKLVDNKYIITDIATYVDATATTKVFMLDSGRKFTITLSGFSTGNRVGVNAITSIAAFVSWKNTNSYFSYMSLSVNKTISSQSIRAAIDNSTSATNSVSHVDGTDIFENGAWPLTFKLRIPRANAGTLKITSVDTGNVVFSLIASTCDFSDDTNYQSASFGSRPVCIPSSNNIDYNKESRRTFGANGTNDNYIEIQLSEITGTSKDLVLNVWGYANKCTDYTGGGLINYTNLLEDTNPSYKLKFEYTYTSGGNDVSKASEFFTNINCYKNMRPLSKAFTSIYNSKDIGISTNDGNGTIKDYLLYTEITNWNPKSGITYTPASADPSTEEKLVVPNGDFISLSQITSDNPIVFNFYIDLTTPSTSVAENFLLPIEAKGGLAQLVSGKYEINLPKNIINTVPSSNCVLAFMYRDEYTDFFSTNGTTAKITATDNKISTNEDIVFKTNTGTTYDDVLESSKFGFYSNCYSYKSYSNITIKSIFQHASILVNFKRLDGSAHRLNRVNRFFKFYNGLTYGFTKENENDSLTTGIKLYRPNGDNDSDKLCILEISKDLFANSDTLGINTLIITLMNKRLAKIGNFEATDYYPASTINSDNYKTYPLYTIELTDLISPNSMNNVSQINSGFLYDSDNLQNIIPFLANSIVLYKSSGNIATDDATSEVLMPVPCGYDDNKDKFLIQGLSMSSSFTITNHIIFTSDETDNIYSSIPISFDTQENDVDLIFKFKGYRDSADNNLLYVSNINPSTSIKAGILLVDGISSDTSDMSTGFFGASYIPGSYSGIKINDISYSNYYFLTGTQTVSDNGTIDFLIRPEYSSYAAATSSTYKIKLHAAGTYTNANTSTSHTAYITNDTTTEAKNIISDDTTELNAPNNADELTFTVSAGETNMYNDDYGAIVTITATIYSDFATTGKLQMNSSNFNADSICALSSNYLSTCTFSGSAMTCDNVSVSAAATTTVTYKCYNVKLSSNTTSGTTTSTFVFAAASNFTSNYDFLNLTAKLTEDKTISVGTNYPLVSTIIPKVDSVNFVQTNNKGGLANAYIKINLIRNYRLGQTVVLDANLSSLMIGTSTPSCSFMIINTPSNYSDIDFFDNVVNGTQFVDSCTVSTTASNTTITLNTNKYLSSTDTFSQYVYVKLSPVYVADLANIKYSITTYLDIITSNTSIAAAPKSGEDRDGFSAGSVSSDAYNVTASTLTGLCNLSEVFPRIPSTIGQLTFKVVLDGTTQLLTTVNTVNEVPNATSKVLNEVSIFMDPSIYMRNENIWCSYNSANIPCTWTSQGYINVKFSTSLVDGDYNITIKGVTIPSIASGKNDSNFNCSVNYFNQDSRENLIVGLGTSTIYTYTPTTAGNIIQYTSPSGMVSTTVPRSTGTFNFRMNIDTSLDLTTLPKTLSATTDGSSPVLLIGFPSEYDLSNIGTVTATLTSTMFSTVTVTDTTDNSESTYTTFGDPATVSTSSIEVKGNFIIVTFTEAITVTSNVAYFDLALNNVPTPWSAVDSSLISIYMINELTAPTMMFSTFSNLNNSLGKKISINDYYHGPSFSFSDSTKALINTSSSSFSLKPGRYMPINFTVSGTNANASTALSLATNATIKSLQSSITLNTGLNNKGSLNLGVSCNTLPGSYWASFSSTATTGFYGLNPIRVIVTPVTGNKASLYVNSVMNTLSSISSYTLVNGGFTRAFINTQYPVVDAIDISFSVPTAATNDAGFTKFSADATEDIAAGKMSSQFSYTISSSETAITTQQIMLTSGSRCFGFGSSTSSTSIISYTVEGTLADLSNVNIASMFLYDVSNEKKNEFDLLFTPIANTNAVFALVCADSEYPTYATATSGSIANLDSTLYKFKSGTYTDTTQTTISFSGLKRGTSYKLKVWLSNFGAADNSLTSYEANSITNSTDTANMVELKTPAVATKAFIKFVFGTAQSDAFTERLLLNTQKFVKSLTPNANIFVARATKGAASVYAEGYGSENVETCSATYFTDNYGDTQSQSDASSSTSDAAAADAAATTLRYLQTGQTYYYSINQSITDSVLVDLTSIRTEVSAKLTTKEALQTFVGSDVTFTGETFATEDVEEVQMTAENFIVDSAAYDKTTGNITLIPKADREITCNWKLNNAADLLTADVILDCAAGTTNCGTIDFKVDNTETTTLAVGTLADGSYYVNVYCASDIPDSTNNIIFKNADALTVTTEVPSETDTSSTAVDCSVTPDDPSCNSMFIKSSITIFALLALAFFDF